MLLSRARTLMRECLEARIERLERHAVKDEATILIQAHLDGELTDRQRRRLTAWLGESRAASSGSCASAVCTANCSICTAGRKTPRGASNGSHAPCLPHRATAARATVGLTLRRTLRPLRPFMLHPSSCILLYCWAACRWLTPRWCSFWEPGCWRPGVVQRRCGRGIRPRHRGARCGFYRAGRPVVRRPHHRTEPLPMGRSEHDGPARGSGGPGP